TEKPGPVEVMSILTHLRVISKEYLPKDAPALTLISIRKALAYELYTNRTSIQAIANLLGIEENSVSNYIKNIMEAIQFQKANSM
ncbi:MAG: integrase, partial [Bacillus sp. (in: firmicutes)]